MHFCGEQSGTPLQGPTPHLQLCTMPLPGTNGAHAMRLASGQ